MNFAKGGLGWIEVVCGPMFSGKSEELIRRLRRAEIARQRVQIFKPGIDQAQFLGMEMVEVAVRLGDMGKRVIIAGLDTDYLGRPFHPMPELLAIADEITKALAICVQCGNPAKHTQRLVASEDLIVVGAAGMYEARCRRCFEPELASLKASQQTVKQT